MVRSIFIQTISPSNLTNLLHMDTVKTASHLSMQQDHSGLFGTIHRLSVGRKRKVLV